MAVKRHYKSWSEQEIAQLQALRDKGYTHDSIAKKLNRSAGAVKQRLSKLAGKQKPEVIKVNKQTLKSMELDVKGIKIHMVFS